MATADDLNQAIIDNAAGPAKASGDTGSIEQHPLADQIEADRYIAGNNAVSKPGRGLRFTQITPPGASGCH